MAQVSTGPPPEGFGATMRRDLWWVGSLATFLGLLWGSRAWLRPPRTGHLGRHRGDSHRPQRAARPAASVSTVSA